LCGPLSGGGISGATTRNCSGIARGRRRKEMFWIVSRTRDAHVVERKLVSYQGMWQQWESKYAHSSNFNPKIGLGDVMIIEAETQAEAWDYAQKQLRADRSSGRWRKPREFCGVASFTNPRNEIMYFAGRDIFGPWIAANFSTSIRPIAIVMNRKDEHWFIHFHTGHFFHLNGLLRHVIEDLIAIYTRR